MCKSGMAYDSKCYNLDMISVLKYIVVPLLGIAFAFLSNYLEGWKLTKKNAGRLRWVILVVSVVAIIVQGIVTWRDDVKTEAKCNADRDNLQAWIGDLKKRNAEMHSELAEAKSNLLMQTRSIGSLVYNMETSPEGKQRFVRCVEALSFLDAENEYRALVCDDGVAVFRFLAHTGEIAGFYFYANSEINEVLSGIPVGKDLAVKNGQILIANDSELAMLMERALERRMPPYAEDEMSRRIALDFARESMRVFFRYVYRAEKYSCDVTKPFGWRVAFHYSVSPMRSDSCDRTVELWMSEADVTSLCGLTQKEYSEKLLAYCRRMNILPKIHAKDIEYLEYGRKRNADAQSFPYSRERMQKLQR